MRSMIETLIICTVAVAPLLLVAYFTGHLTTDTGVVNADIIELVEDLNEPAEPNLMDEIDKLGQRANAIADKYIAHLTRDIALADAPLFEQLFDSIPTWPEYYEVKDDISIYLESPDQEPGSEFVIKAEKYYPLIMEFKKGVKIYKKGN